MKLIPHIPLLRACATAAILIGCAPAYAASPVQAADWPSALDPMYGPLETPAPLDVLSAGLGGLSFELGSTMDAFGANDTITALAPITAVPESGTCALMLAGLGVVGFVMQRRRALAG